MINRLCGGVVISPWEVGDLPDEWLDAFRSLATQGQSIQNARARIDKNKMDWLQKFKHYNKAQ
jgi:hypothetical protein